MAKIPSPCIGVCKYKRDDHCIGCSMNKDQKKIFKTLKKARMQQAFIKMLCAQQEAFGGSSDELMLYAQLGGDRPSLERCVVCECMCEQRAHGG